MIDIDEDQRWIVLRRGRVAIACNVGEAEARRSPPDELLSWGGLDVGAETTRMPSHSVVILRAPACG